MIKKNVEAKIYDLDNGNFISDIDLEIELVLPSNPNEKPHYEVIGKIHKTIVEISDKSFILELKPELRGCAFLTMIGFTQWLTEFKVYLQDSIWLNLGWFESL